MQGDVKAARLAEPVVGLTHPVQGKLIFLAAVFLQPAADLIVQVEGVAQDGEGNAMLFHESQQLPEIGMQDGVAAGDVEVGQPAIDLTEIQAVEKGVAHLLPGHGIQVFAGILGEDVAVLAALVTCIGDVPLKGKILFHHL